MIMAINPNGFPTNFLAENKLSFRSSKYTIINMVNIFYISINILKDSI